MIYAIDIDRTICHSWGEHYGEYVPIFDAIKKVNQLYDGGHTIKIFTGRGSQSGVDWREFTEKQLDDWGVKYHCLIMGKPHADKFIDDKAMSTIDWLHIPMPMLVMIVGAKGVGKTEVRRLLGRRGFSPVCNEDYYLQMGKQNPDKDITRDEDIQNTIYKMVECILRHKLTQDRLVVYEATGTNKRWLSLKNSLSKDCLIQVIKVSSPDASYNLQGRSWVNNYPVSQEHIAHISSLSNDLQFDSEIVNSGTLQELDIQVEGIYQKLGNRKLVATGGGFDPVHVGHLELFKRAKALGDRLVVILNTDDWIKKKKGYVFMPLADRQIILESIKYVDATVVSIDGEGGIIRTIELLRPHIYAKGGDRQGNTEAEVCNRIGCQRITGLGEKIRSSSDMVNRMVIV